MNYGKVEERSSSRSRSPNTARRAVTSAILTDILSKSDRAPTSHTADARPGKSVLIVPERVVAHSEKGRHSSLGHHSREVATRSSGTARCQGLSAHSSTPLELSFPCPKIHLRRYFPDRHASFRVTDLRPPPFRGDVRMRLSFSPHTAGQQERATARN